MKKIALVGCGAIAKTYGLIIQELGYVCVGVTDISPEAAKRFSQKYPELRADWLTHPDWVSAEKRAELRAKFDEPAVYSDLDALIEGTVPDVVIVGTWPGSHAELVCRSAEKGVPAIICEKPMALSESECSVMVDTCEQQNARLAVCHDSCVLMPQFKLAREMISEGQIGEVEFIRANTSSTLMDWSVYLWAAMHYLLPDHPVTLINAAMDCRKQAEAFGHIQEDHSTIHFRMKDGLSGILLTGQKVTTAHGIRIDGKAGSLEVSFLRAPMLRVWKEGDKNWETLVPPRTCLYDERRAFVKGVAEDDPDFRRFYGASASVPSRLVFAAWQSYFQRQPVELSRPVSFAIPKHWEMI